MPMDTTAGPGTHASGEPAESSAGLLLLWTIRWRPWTRYAPSSRELVHVVAATGCTPGDAGRRCMGNRQRLNTPPSTSTQNGLIRLVSAGEACIAPGGGAASRPGTLKYGASHAGVAPSTFYPARPPPMPRGIPPAASQVPLTRPRCHALKFP